MNRKKILTLIQMKLKIFDPYGLGILHAKSQKNLRQIFFFEIEGSPIWIEIKNFLFHNHKRQEQFTLTQEKNKPYLLTQYRKRTVRSQYRTRTVRSQYRTRTVRRLFPKLDLAPKFWGINNFFSNFGFFEKNQRSHFDEVVNPKKNPGYVKIGHFERPKQP